MKTNKIHTTNSQTVNFNSKYIKIANWNINKQAIYHFDKFITENNKPLHETIKTNYRLQESAPLDLFLTQNMKISRNEINDMKNFRNFVMNKIKGLGFCPDFIGNAKMAITATLSKALLNKEDENKAPSACGTQQYYKNYFPDFERYSIQQGQLGDCYFLATLDSLIKKDNGYEYITSLFKNDDISDLKIGIKLKNYETEVNFPKDDLAYITSTKLMGTSPHWTRTLEIAFAKMTNKDLYKTILSYLEDENYPKMKEWREKQPMEESLFNKNSVFGKINVLGNAGYSNVTYRLLGLKNVKDHYFSSGDKNRLINVLKKTSTFATTAILKDVDISTENKEYSDTLVNNHAYSLHSYDAKNDLFIISNPHYSGVDIKVSWDFLCDKCCQYTTAELPDRNTWYEYHPPYREPEWYELPDKECEVNWDMYL